MNDVMDTSTPRYQLSFEELPRGFVPWPKIHLELLERDEARTPFGRFAEEYRLDTLTRCTLRYYYDGLDVAYRPAEGGMDVLAVGWDEAVKYLSDPTVKVVQA